MSVIHFRKSMRKWYLELHDVNTDLIRGYNIRCKNHQELLDALKQLNVIIQKAAQLRGKYSLCPRVQFCQPKRHFQYTFWCWYYFCPYL